MLDSCSCPRCRSTVLLTYYAFQSRHGFGPWREVQWAGGVCPSCDSVVQYGKGGTALDYMHARFWILGKLYECRPGRARRWPPE